MLAASALILAACAKPPGGPAPVPPAAGQAAGDQPSKPSRIAAAPSLAYAYAVSLAAPAQKLPDLLASHQAACAAAGPALCQVTSASMENEGKAGARGALALRAAPAWLSGFRAHLGAEAKAFGGRITHSTLTSEDLSTQVIDVQAAIRAKTALRDRLQGLLQNRVGKTADFLEVAKDLADVQADLDATQSQLAAMQSRLQMSVLRIDYESTNLMGGAWAPLKFALSGATSALAGTLAAMVTLMVMIAPWAAVIAGAILAVRLMGSRRPSRMAPGAKAPADPVA
jgi:hypothetical protein